MRMPSPIEHEIKLRVEDAESARRALSDIGATVARARHFEDNILFDTRRRTLRSSGRVLRLRRNDRGAQLTVKGQRRDVQGVKARAEGEVGVEDPEKTETLLRLLGYEPVFRYQKYREVWRWRDAEIVLDETPVGVFLEIEGPIETIHAAAKALGRKPEDFILDSYVALFFAGGGEGDMVFPQR